MALIVGTEGPDVLSGQNGDRVDGEGGDDRLTGGGNVYLEGGDGDDVLNGVGGDRLEGGAGDDVLSITGGFANKGDVYLDGGLGHDRIVIDSGGAVTLKAYSGDRITVSDYGLLLADTGFGSYTTIVYANYARFSLGAGLDVVEVKAASHGTTQDAPSLVLAHFTAGDRGDVVDLAGYLEGTLTNWNGVDNPFATQHLRLVQAGSTLRLEMDVNGGGNQWTLLAEFPDLNIGTLTAHNLAGYDPAGGAVVAFAIDGAMDNDPLMGGASNDLIYGGVKADLLRGRDGDDSLWGGRGDDHQLGGAGNDRLEGGAGDDLIEGGWGIDTVVFVGPATDHVLTFGNGVVTVQSETDGRDTLRGVEFLSFSDGLMAVPTANWTLSGGDGADLLVGGDDGDLISGGAGNDILVGGLGDDRIVGGAGQDIFRGSRAELAGDVISDFALGDVINVSDADLSSFTFTRSDATVSLGGGSSLTLAGNPQGRLIASADGQGGVNLSLATRLPTMNFVADFNGDDINDLAWREVGGAFSTWALAAQPGQLSVTQNVFTTAIDPSWRLATAADFDGDGKDDLMWRREGGTFALWRSTGNDFVMNVVVDGTVSPDWSLAAAGDFNGDGKADLIWRHSGGFFTEWQSTGTSFEKNVYADAGVDVAWSLSATGDFNGDGKDDLIWREDGGTFTVWMSTGSGFQMNAVVDGSVGPDWSLALAGDFDGDGKDDLIWRHSDGGFSEWRSTGDGFQKNVHVDFSVGVDWRLESAGDFNGDLRADLLWRHDGGAFSIWQSAGTSFLQNVLVDGTVGANWSLAALGYDFV
ncbi:FG-GAP-like repeat-containing protein [Caulobacter sp. UNC279MFTsu5.1]|uniref:FG-GAP-like repeat-containing protein n=1 Tax=Caulobacter sp. UNC279MFTsu5.1 TaxID=1502775 RepID=UPI0003A037CD|nr:FG-GAP-like repeat-containing protein [Caulobacter sp. UNC279MFTsu5.1]SFJ03106.1 Ca2+-binding protein, RTX toxin-related [Caulobacter sp. UNC279MFTsu5.1]